MKWRNLKIATAGSPAKSRYFRPPLIVASTSLTVTNCEGLYFSYQFVSFPLVQNLPALHRRQAPFSRLIGSLSSKSLFLARAAMAIHYFKKTAVVLKVDRLRRIDPFGDSESQAESFRMRTMQTSGMFLGLGHIQAITISEMKNYGTNRQDCLHQLSPPSTTLGARNLSGFDPSWL